MGNVTGRGDGEGTSSGEKKDGLCDEEGFEQFHQRTMLRFSPFNPMAYQLPSTSSQIPSTSSQNISSQRKKAGLIMWSHGAREVSLTGSWDNWETIEPLHPLGKDFVTMKMLPPDVYHYRFVVDQQMRFAPDFPWEHDGSGNAYNILDLRDFVQGAHGSPFGFASPPLRPISSHESDRCPPPPFTIDQNELLRQKLSIIDIIPEPNENLSEFESPPSPISSYNNEPLTDEDFSKLPPELPPQLRMTLMPEPSSAGRSHQSLPTPHHSLLNHLCIRNSGGVNGGGSGGGGGQFVTLGSIFRFRQKYVTLVLYKSSQR